MPHIISSDPQKNSQKMKSSFKKKTCMSEPDKLRSKFNTNSTSGFSTMNQTPFQSVHERHQGTQLSVSSTQNDNFKLFYSLGIDIKLHLPSNHPGKQISIENLYNRAMS